jgi:hypothetical protein
LAGNAGGVSGHDPHIELDYMQEAQHAAIFRKHFASWRDVYVPRFYPELSTSRVLVMEYITGFAVGVSAAYGRFRMTEFDVAGARSPQSANRLLTILVAGHI